MKKLFLVKGDERHEVVDCGDWVRFVETRESIYRATFVNLGYKLEEQAPERREWVACWDDGGSMFFYDLDKKKHNWDNEVQVTELREGERVISREDAKKAWGIACTGAYVIKEKVDFFKALGFIEGDS